MGKTPLYLVTGFLGSGKTTFIEGILQQFDRHYKIGVIQNEFAPANIDGAVLKSSGRSFEMLEINNGSVFCVCLMGDFTRSLATFIREKRPDLLFIEASGLSDPASIIEIAQAPELVDLVSLRETWCIVDARHLQYLEHMLQRIRHQIMIADRIIVNKKDLVGKEILAGIIQFVTSLNPYAHIYETTFCRIDFKLIKGTEGIPRAYDSGLEPGSAEQGRPDMGVGVFKTGRRISLQDLDDLIRYYAGATARIKGNVLLANGHTALVQTVFNEVNINLSDQHHGNTCLVILGKDFSLSGFSKHFRSLTKKNEHQIL